eukprot:1572808-Alexandrium_andersonii.AAC.1
MFELVQGLNMHDLQVCHVCGAHGTVQHETAQSFHGRMWLWPVNLGVSRLASIRVVGGPSC